MKRLLLFLLLFTAISAEARVDSIENLHEAMNDLLAQVSPISPMSDVSESRDMVFLCFLSRKPCPIDGQWMPGRSARLRVSKVFRPNSQQVAKAKKFEARYQALMYSKASVSSEVLLSKMNDLLGEMDGPTMRERNLRDAQGRLVQCFINNSCTLVSDYGLFSSRHFSASAQQRARAQTLLRIFDSK